MGRILCESSLAFAKAEKLTMGKSIIHFAHANGFPMACYGELIAELQEEYDVIGKPVLAHDPRFPVQEGWNTSADEIIHFIETTANEKVIGIGHSFGGSITLKAAAKRPDLFNGIVLLDPVMMVGIVTSTVTKLLKRTGRIGAITPADKTEGRRRMWSSREEALSYFKGKALFKDFTEKAIDLYVEHGLYEDAGSLHLTFDVPTEVSIYKCVPTDIDLLAKTPLAIPGSIIRGAKTDVAYKPLVNRVARQHNMDVATISGGHMFPFEVPSKAADLIRSKLALTKQTA